MAINKEDDVCFNQEDIRGDLTASKETTLRSCTWDRDE